VLYGDEDPQETDCPQLPQDAIDVVDAINMMPAIEIAISAFMIQLLLRDGWLLFNTFCQYLYYTTASRGGTKVGLMR
jgi:hypothetical protein